MTLRSGLAAVLMAVSGFSPAIAESPSRASLYFDADAVGGATVAFNPQVALPPIREYVSPGTWSYDPHKSAKFNEPRQRPGETRPSWRIKGEDEISFGRVPLNGGTFGLETERRFNADKNIPSSQLLDSNLEKHTKRPFIGLSIEAPYASEDH
ncbi:MAG TPA: hypothetical protein VNR41_00470 [Xanthobacteraceae bacterium]|nr:hypothetical protein [Xanthobacteraceae bacterium]